MKYMMLIHQGPAIGDFESLPEDERKAIYDAYRAINETPGVSPGLQLQPPRRQPPSAFRTARR